MAALVIEDGTVVTGSNSYVTAVEINDYVSNRGLTAIASPATMAHQAMDYLEQQMFKGDKFSENQPLQWPRYGVNVDGFYIDTDEIPLLLKEAQIELVIGIAGGANPLANIARETRREKVGDIDVEYASTANNQEYLKAAHYKLNKLLRNNGALAAMRI